MPNIVFYDNFSYFCTPKYSTSGACRPEILNKMWQRIQTLYLALSTILIAVLLFCNACTIIGAEGAEETVKYYENIVYLIFIIAIISGNGFTLFTYKARIAQMRLAVIEAIIMTAFQIWIGVDFFRMHEHREVIFSFTAVFPLIAAILNIMAARSIALDEALVQAAYRLRGSNRKK